MGKKGELKTGGPKDHMKSVSKKPMHWDKDTRKGSGGSDQSVIGSWKKGYTC